MKKHRLTKVLGLGIVIVLLIALFAVPASASTTSRQATLQYNNIRITLDGKEITPKDANGNTVEPFTIDGSTYLPVRAVANALNLGVDWDGNTSTVILKSQSAVSVIDATLVEVDGEDSLVLHVKNNLSTNISKIVGSIYGYDADNKPVMNGTTNILRVTSSKTLAPGSLIKTYWYLNPELPGVAYVEFAITQYTMEDGTVVDIPFDRQIRNSVSR